MNCPACGSTSKVAGSKRRKDGRRERWRKCLACSTTFSTRSREELIKIVHMRTKSAAA